MAGELLFAPQNCAHLKAGNASAILREVQAGSGTGAPLLPSAISGGLHVSDQDFFFDEDEKPAKSGGAVRCQEGGSIVFSQRVRVRPQAAAAPAAAQSVSMTVAVLIGVIGLLLGAVIGLFVGKSMAVPTVAVTPGAGTGTGTTQQAPQLTPEQLQGGELPAGSPRRRRRGDRHARTLGTHENPRGPAFGLIG